VLLQSTGLQSGDLIESLQAQFEQANKQTADKLIEDITVKPHIISQRWFLSELFKQSASCQLQVKKWLEELNSVSTLSLSFQTQEMYLQELDKANQTLKDKLRERATAITEPFVEDVLREAGKLESRPIYNMNHQGSRPWERRSYQPPQSQPVPPIVTPPPPVAVSEKKQQEAPKSRNLFYDEQLSTSCKIEKRHHAKESWAEENPQVKSKKRVTFNLDDESYYTSRDHPRSGVPQYDS